MAQQLQAFNKCNMLIRESPSLGTNSELSLISLDWSHDRPDASSFTISHALYQFQRRQSTQPQAQTKQWSYYAATIKFWVATSRQVAKLPVAHTDLTT